MVTLSSQSPLLSKKSASPPFKSFKKLSVFVVDMEFNIIIEQGEDGYLISEVVELPGCHTQAKTMDELLARTREAISVYLKSQDKPVLNGRFLGVQKMEVAV